MRIRTLIIASRSEVVAHALHQSLSLFFPCDWAPYEIESFVFRSSAQLCQKLEQLEASKLPDSIVLLDAGGERFDIWNVGEHGPQLGIASELVLGFPEVYTVFFNASEAQAKSLQSILGIRDAGDPDWEIIQRYHFVSGYECGRLISTISLHQTGFRSAFDPTGLRSGLKQYLFTTAFGREGSVYAEASASRRANTAIVLDEELPFVYLNGFAAYKAGYRTWLASSFAEYERLLLEPPNNPVPLQFDTGLSDWDLIYPDFVGERPKQSLLIGADTKPREGAVVAWYIITSYPETARKYAQPLNPRLLSKPYHGFFALWKSNGDDEGQNGAIAARYASAWDWRSRFQRDPGTLKAEAAVISNHSAPFASNDLASRLLARARSLYGGNDATTETWTRIALLAQEAKEILGGTSRTTTYECLNLGNEAEVHAEASFFGTSARIEASQRLDALELEVEAIDEARRSANAERGKAALNFLIQTANNLRIHFREYEQFHAAEECLRRLANYELEYQASEIRMEQDKSRGATKGNGAGSIRETLKLPGRCLLLAMSWYLDRVTKSGTSVGRLFCVSIGWVLAFGVLYGIWFQFHPELSQQKFGGFPHAFAHSALTFVELQPGLQEYIPLKGSSADPSWKVVYLTLLLLELVVAYFHLGLLVAVLYRRLTKAST